MDIRVVLCLAVMNIPFYSLLGTLLYGSRDKFRSAVTLRNLTDLQPWLHGGTQASFHTDLVLGLYLGGCLGLIATQYRLLQAFFNFGQAI